MSTLIAGYVGHFMMFNKDKQISIICINQKKAVNLLKKIKLIFKQLPDWLRPKVVEDNKKSIVLANGSVCYAQGTTQNAGRSQSLSLLIFDQAAFIQGIEQIWKAAYPTLSTGGCCILNTTPNGVNWFFKIHSAGKNGQNDFFPMQLQWWLHPDRGQKWKQDQIKNLGGQRRFKQQHQIDFQASGKSIVDLTTIMQIQDNIKKYFFQPIKNDEVSDLYNRIINRIADQGLIVTRQTIEKLWIFETPKENVYYAITCDTSSGVADDFSTRIVWDVNNYSQVRQFRGKIKPNMYGYFLLQLGKYYKNRYIAVQNNKDGSAVNIKLEQLKYFNIYYSQRNRKNDFGMTLQVSGFDTNGKTRPVMIARMCQDVSRKHTVIKSKRLLQQLKTFVDNGGKAQRLSGYNDDLVIRLCIFCYLRSFILSRRSDLLFVNRFSSNQNAGVGSQIQDGMGNKVEGWYI